MTSTLDFRSQGACVGVDPALFYPGRGDNFAAAEARSVCLDCPVREDCAEWAIRHERQGIWGGLSEKERRRLRKARGITVETPDALAAPHGTSARYQAHRRAGERACAPCRRAHSTDQASARARRGA